MQAIQMQKTICIFIMQLVQPRFITALIGLVSTIFFICSEICTNSWLKRIMCVDFDVCDDADAICARELI